MGMLPPFKVTPIKRTPLKQVSLSNTEKHPTAQSKKGCETGDEFLNDLCASLNEGDEELEKASEEFYLKRISDDNRSTTSTNSKDLCSSGKDLECENIVPSERNDVENCAPIEDNYSFHSLKASLTNNHKNGVDSTVAVSSGSNRDNSEISARNYRKSPISTNASIKTKVPNKIQVSEGLSQMSSKTHQKSHANLTPVFSALNATLSDSVEDEDLSNFLILERRRGIHNQIDSRSGNLQASTSRSNTHSDLGTTSSELFQDTTPKNIRSSDLGSTRDFPAVNERNIYRSLSSLATMLVDMNVQIGNITRFLHEKIGAASNNATEASTEGFPTFPISTIDQLKEFEILLADQTSRTAASRRFSAWGGRIFQDTIRRILKNVISHDVILLCNWNGANGKLAFQNLNIKIAIIDAVRFNARLKLVTDFQIESIIKKWLNHAKDRQGGRAVRAAVAANQNNGND